MRTASCGLLIYAKRRFDYFRDRTYRCPSLLSIPASIFYSFASIAATPWIEARLARTLKLLPVIAVETPHATNLWKSLATRLGADPEKIHYVPHPIQTDIFTFDPAIPKKNQIISVGRWDSYQKNLPLLLKTLRAFLDKNPTWSSLVIGSGLPTKSPHPQTTFLPPTAPAELAPLMQESKIFLSASRYESFGLASAEASACGCAFVGTSQNQILEPYPSRPNDSTKHVANCLAEKIDSASRLKLIEATLFKQTANFSPQNVAKLFLLLLPSSQ
jgi:glycosyltransferase involved in cell wall biosynthesis